MTETGARNSADLEVPPKQKMNDVDDVNDVAPQKSQEDPNYKNGYS